MKLLLVPCDVQRLLSTAASFLRFQKKNTRVFRMSNSAKDASNVLVSFSECLDILRDSFRGHFSGAR